MDPAYLVHIDSADLGDKILLCAKAAAEIDILPPAPKGYKQPVLKLPGAGVRSFKDLLRKFSFINVIVVEDNYCFHSFRNGGDRVGYVPDGQPIRSLQIAHADGDPAMVADLVRSIFLLIQ
ncbi:hypothetical protein [Prosthecodimorpha hirschii]|uniref:hypothetical protein n=1 Tax=Prosthecodimorpha hirschii TaxID=665126 RepID=UPI00112E7476|nr:hypothetical protein [Prosthecomicrobium hirschii]